MSEVQLGLLPPRSSDRGGLAVAFGIALALHTAAIGWALLWRSNTIVAPPGEQQVAIDLAPQMVDAPTDQTVETAQPAGDPSPAPSADVDAVAPAAPPPDDVKPPDPETAPPPPMPAVETPPPETAAPPVPSLPPPVLSPEAATPTAPATASDAVLPPDVEPIGTTALEAFSLPSTTVEAHPVLPPTPRRPPDRKPVLSKPPRPQPRTTKLEARSGASGRARQEIRGASSRENDGGSAAAADPNALSRYAGELAAALRSRMRYPEEGGGGTAVLRFTVQRSGRVLSASLARSAGDPAIDAAALATARPGTALPAAPEGLPQQVFTISVPLQFNRR